MLDAASKHVLLERVSEYVALIRLNRPEKRNALTNAMVIEIGRMLTEAANDSSVRAVVLAGDILVAGSGAKFGQPEVKIGGIPGDGGTQRLARRVGQGFASLMIMTGDPIDAETALRIGLVVEVCPAGRAEARATEIATTIASRAPLAVQEAKACIAVAVGATRENGLAFERDGLWRIIQSPDSREGRAAFLEKRAPRFTGTR
jgi:enoyl-CoA hydratase/carnithine racemase